MPTLLQVTHQFSRQVIDQLLNEYGSIGNLHAKFIRVNNIIMIAPLIECEPIDGQPGDLYPQHISILKIGADAGLYPNDSTPTDAGHISYIIGQITVGGESALFGRGDNEERAQTIELITNAVGSDTKVFGW